MRFSREFLTRRVPLAAFGLVLLSACTVVVDEGPDRPRPGPGPGPQYCTREYDPVCARRGDDRRTFANGCLAERAGYRITRGGECRGNGPGPGPGPWPGPGSGPGPRPEPQFCTREYRPVCGQRRDSLRTFPNACEADAAGYRVVDNGPC